MLILLKAYVLREEAVASRKSDAATHHAVQGSSGAAWPPLHQATRDILVQVPLLHGEINVGLSSQGSYDGMLRLARYCKPRRHAEVFKVFHHKDGGLFLQMLEPTVLSVVASIPHETHCTERGLSMVYCSDSVGDVWTEAR